MDELDLAIIKGIIEKKTFAEIANGLPPRDGKRFNPSFVQYRINRLLKQNWLIYAGRKHRASYTLSERTVEYLNLNGLGSWIGMK